MTTNIDHSCGLRLRAPFNVRGLLLAALAASSVACGGGGDGGDSDDDGGDDTAAPPYVNGYAVDCLPGDGTEPLVCMMPDDFNCPNVDYYVRKGVCAQVLDGTPSMYDPKLAVIDPDGAGPAEETFNIFCDDLPAGFLQGWGAGEGCSDCRVCSMQQNEFMHNPEAQGPVWWNEVPWCPIEEQDLVDFCDPMADPPPPPPPDTQIWQCTGSGDLVGTKININDSQQNVSVQLSLPYPPVCVSATGVVDAYENCEDYCEAQNDFYAGMIANDPNWNWSPFNCALLDFYTPVTTAYPNTDCHNGVVATTAATIPFIVDARLTTPLGEATGAPTGGLMGITPPDPSCKVGPCEISIVDLRSETFTVHGSYTASGAPTSVPFVVGDLQFRLLQPVRGEFDPNTNAVSFPADQFFTVVSAGEVTLDGAMLSRGLDHAPFLVSEATGEWDGTSLTLELVWEVGGVELGMSLTSF